MTQVLLLAVASSSQNFPGLVGLLAVVCLLALSGAAISADRTPVLMVVRGWALSTVLAIALPLVGVRSMSWVAIPLVAVAAIGIFRLYQRRMGMSAAVPGLLLGAPLIVLSAIVPSTYWDTYLHWLPNALQTMQTGQLLSAPLPAGFYSMHPTYPPALAIPVYLSSRITGDFASGAAQTLGSILLVLTSLQVAAAIAPQLSVSDRIKPWLAAGIALGALALLNPALHDFGYWPSAQSMQFWSAIADPAIAVLMVILLFTVVDHVAPANAPAQEIPPRDSPDLVSLFALGALIATLKHSGWSIVIVLLSAAAIVGVVTGLARRALLTTICAVALGAIAATGLWELYLAKFLPLADQFSIQHPQHWRLDLLPALLESCWGLVRSNLLFYGLCAAALVLGIRYAISSRKRTLCGLQLAIAISGLTFAGHLASLLMAYLGTGFEEWEIAGAHSWQRYATQAGFACCCVVLLRLLMRITAWRPRLPIAAPRAMQAAALVLVLAYLPTLRSAAGAISLYHEGRDESRKLAIEALRQIPASTRIAVVGHDWSAIFARYSTWAEFDAVTRPLITAVSYVVKVRDIPEAVERSRQWQSDPSIDCILILNAMDFAMQLGLPSQPDHLWCRGFASWKVLDLQREQPHRLPAS